jgi:predicted esterase
MVGNLRIGLLLLVAVAAGCVPAESPAPPSPPPSASPPSPPEATSAPIAPDTTNAANANAEPPEAKQDPFTSDQPDSALDVDPGARVPLSPDLDPGLHTLVFERPGAPPVGYLLFLPAGYRTGARWPTIFYLHGRSLSGDDPHLLTKYGIPKIVSRDPSFPFIVVAPQCHEGERWTDVATLDALLGDVMRRVPVDPDRVYLTGFSMGAGGAWRFGGAHPERFAAIAALAGVEEVGSVKGLARVPVWVFHGTDDEATPASASEAMVAALRGAGGNVRLELLPGRRHDIVDVYERKDLYTWFLTHRRR